MTAAPGEDRQMLVWWVAAIAFFVVTVAVVLFNDLVAARNQVRAAWSDIDVQLTRRQGYAAHERSTLTLLTELRTRAMRAAKLRDKAALEDELAQQIDRIFALQEQYPDLKASDNFLALQRDLVDIENHLQYARRFYNGSVRELNNRIQTFPSVIVARLARFREAEFYRHGGDVQQAPA
jgi:LemA protein